MFTSHHCLLLVNSLLFQWPCESGCGPYCILGLNLLCLMKKLQCEILLCCGNNEYEFSLVDRFLLTVTSQNTVILNDATQAVGAGFSLCCTVFNLKSNLVRFLWSKWPRGGYSTSISMPLQSLLLASPTPHSLFILSSTLCSLNADSSIK
jgi:hypothetical protein